MTVLSRIPKAVLFDLDGTLIDSAPDIREALNETLAMEGVAPFDLQTVKHLVGGGVQVLIERAFRRRGLPLSPEDCERIAARFVATYEPRSTRLTDLTPGAREAVDGVKALGAKTGVVTNKPEAATRAILAHYGLADPMDIVIGGDAGPKKKPAPDLLLLAANQLGLDPTECLFVGDSENDVEAAKAAVMPVAALENGYTALAASDLGADILLSRVDDLLRHLPQKVAS
ncbi:MAG: phosphoglycolate phosphatase [Fulvimarina manganoxydans]|uniref:phosphoglycolate phosphatase n=1 Tax=Fulvimarina manganoxydans TaxID=937218 RepID=UPI00235418DA|nr:phosphoglycolate phosphatase [Fulvimarina manganoxydans]MCK5932267.1 phosphoglycolate phosphatase [Fulvimarina manganoxydans]